MFKGMQLQYQLFNIISQLPNIFLIIFLHGEEKIQTGFKKFRYLNRQNQKEALPFFKSKYLKKQSCLFQNQEDLNVNEPRNSKKIVTYLDN
eukprot:TRINITY_DN10221_c0_g1_i2.p2 TRINITY_DN10221_c0_g1~~TRINITY_DN10221_c0_g1_i2.p2  ORF type:complete len:100 (+),score=5.00 TRINITY_DN10221_c0_g1_i2:28-300(+)